MEIEEYRPEPPHLQPPEPKRKDLSIVWMSLFLAGVFLTTLAVLNRAEIAGYARQFASQNVSRAIPHVIPPPKPAFPNAAYTTIAVAAPVSETIKRVLQCFSGKALSPEELTHVTQALNEEIIAPLPPSAPALNGALDLQNISAEQVAELSGMLNRIGWPLGLQAQSAFQQGLTEGTCRLAPSARLPEQ
jgi:hypothetical protein